MERDTMGGMLGTALGATMIGAGLWMLLRDRDDDMTEAAEAIGAGETETTGRVHALADRAGELRGRAVERTRSATARTRSYVGDSPLVAGLAALALGALAGAVIPESQREHQLLGEYRDRVAEKAREAARDAMDKGRDMVGNAVQTATENIKQQVMGGGNDRDDRNLGIRHDAEV